ncbi:PTS sugar transporter subunit IIA, partial [Burkholderia sp. SIMBA_013]
GATAPAEPANQGAHAAEPATGVEGKDILLRDSVVLLGSARDRDAAIDEVGQLLLDRGAVDMSYVHAMHEREESVSTYMGSFLAIP